MDTDNDKRKWLFNELTGILEEISDRPGTQFRLLNFLVETDIVFGRTTEEEIVRERIEHLTRSQKEGGHATRQSVSPRPDRHQKGPRSG